MAERSLSLCLWMAVVSVAFAQSPRQQVPSSVTRDPVYGFYLLQANNLHLTTDVPIDAELEAWPKYLSQAIEQWTQEFGNQATKLLEAKLRVYLIADYSKFEKAGLLEGVPSFDEGYQLNNLLVIREQPTPYYRRHLFLHEATHWCYATVFGGCGSPWFMEGMADYYGTHVLTKGRLYLGAIPRAASDFPNWGRFRLIANSIEQKDAPNLDQILDYQSDRDRLKRYAWSWAAVNFFRNHPRYRDALVRVSQRPMDYSATLSNSLRSELKPIWSSVQMDWNGFVSDFDFGFDPSRSMVDSQETMQTKLKGSNRSLVLRTDRGWQSSGVVLKKGESVHIECEGRFTVRERKGTSATPWQSEADGISIEYHRENPLGSVLATVQPLGEDATRIWNSVRIGRDGIISAADAGPDGALLLLKINEPSGELFDNSGELSVTVSRIKP